MEGHELGEPRKEGSAWDDLRPSSLTSPGLEWVSLPTADIYVYFSLVFSSRSLEPSSLTMTGVTGLKFLPWIVFGILCKQEDSDLL